MTQPIPYRVARVENPLALQIPEVMDLLERWSPDPQRWWPILDLVRLDTGGVLVGAVGQDLCALAIVTLPVETGTSCPQIAHFHCDGGAKLRNLLVRGVVDFLREKGYGFFWAMNQSGAADSTWARAFRLAGEARRIGTVMEFTLPGAKKDASAVRRVNTVLHADKHDAAGDRSSPGGLGEHAVKPVRARRRTRVGRPVRGKPNRRRNTVSKPAPRQRRHGAAKSN
jgi:hypothetical protein